MDNSFKQKLVQPQVNNIPLQMYAQQMQMPYYSPYHTFMPMGQHPSTYFQMPGMFPYQPYFPTHLKSQIQQNPPKSYIPVNPVVQELRSIPQPQVLTQNQPKPTKIQGTPYRRQANPIIETQQQSQLGPMTCHCTKTGCMKQYCICFKSGVACAQSCFCINCKNNQNQLNQKRHPKGPKKVKCKCSKSQCIKKYCQCYSANKKCEGTCQCVGCQN